MNKYIGQLQMHAEQGCGLWPQFHDDRGLHGDKKQYWNWDYTINFGKGTKLSRLVIYNENDEVLYDGSWTFCRINTAKAKYVPCCEELEPIEWFEMVHNCKRAIVYTDLELPGGI